MDEGKVHRVAGFPLKIKNASHEAWRENVSGGDLVFSVDHKLPFKFRIFKLDQFITRHVHILKELCDAGAEQSFCRIRQDNGGTGKMFIELGYKEESTKDGVPMCFPSAFAVGTGRFILGKKK